MTFDDTIRAGQILPPAVRDGDLFRLVHDAMFPALLSVLDEMKLQVTAELCAPESAAVPGMLPRAAGQLSALEELKERLRAAFIGAQVKE